MASSIERLFNRGPLRELRGVCAWALAVLPWTALAFWGRSGNSVGWLVDAFLLYFALGGRSLAEHAERVAGDLAAGDLPAAREHVGWIVSRNTSELDESGVAKACVESTLENGNDAVFGALFWFALFGGAGAVLFRLSNTLDAMWGYKTERFLRFGWAAARIDDVLNYVPARLTALLLCLVWRDEKGAGLLAPAGAGVGKPECRTGDVGPAREASAWRSAARPSTTGSSRSARCSAKGGRRAARTFPGRWPWCGAA